MAAHKLQKRIKLYGFEISIENAKGSLRTWYDPHGKEKGSTKMHFDYGYIRNTLGTDGDHVDVYVGPNPESDTVFIVDQKKKPAGSKKGDGAAWTAFDEQKVMLAFKDAESAKAAYLKQYDDPRFFGSMKEMPVTEFSEKVLDKANHGKKVAERQAKHASLMAEINLSRMAEGMPILRPKLARRAEVLGDHVPAITTLPPISNYAHATMSKAERKDGERQVKEAADGRVGRIADRVDDVGIGLLAAPYAADVASHQLGRAKSPKLKALSAAIGKGLGTGSSFGKSHAREISGLAMVAPGVTHTLAKGIDKATSKKANGDMLQYFADHPDKLKEKQERDKKSASLEKIAHQLFDDYEYKTEAEKVAIMQFLGRLAGGAAGSAKKVVAGAKNLAQGGGTGTSRMLAAMTPAERAAVAPVAPSMGQKFRAGMQSASRGREVSPAAVQRLERMKAAPASAAGGAAAAAAPAAAGAAPAAAKSKWNPLRPRNLVLGAGATAVGLGAYGGFKGIQTGANLLQHQHETPLAPPMFSGPGRSF